MRLLFIVNQFHGDIHSKTPSCSKIKPVFREYKMMPSVFSTGRDIASITHFEVKCLVFFHGSETNVPTYFLSVLNTGRQLRT